MSRQRARRQPPEARQQQPHPAHSAPAGRLTLDSDERALRLEPGRDCDRSTSRDARPVRLVTKGATAASRLSLRTPTLAPGPQAVRGPSWPTRGPRGEASSQHQPPGFRTHARSLVAPSGLSSTAYKRGAVGNRGAATGTETHGRRWKSPSSPFTFKRQLAAHFVVVKGLASRTWLRVPTPRPAADIQLQGPRRGEGQRPGPAPSTCARVLTACGGGRAAPSTLAPRGEPPSRPAG